MADNHCPAEGRLVFTGGATAAPSWEIGFEVEGLLIVLRVGADGPSAALDPGQRPGTVLVAEAETVVALVTGASSGLGVAIAVGLAEAGHLFESA